MGRSTKSLNGEDRQQLGNVIDIKAIYHKHHFRQVNGIIDSLGFEIENDYCRKIMESKKPSIVEMEFITELERLSKEDVICNKKNFSTDLCLGFFNYVVVDSYIKRFMEFMHKETLKLIAKSLKKRKIINKKDRDVILDYYKMIWVAFDKIGYDFRKIKTDVYESQGLFIIYLPDEEYDLIKDKISDILDIGLKMEHLKPSKEIHIAPESHKASYEEKLELISKPTEAIGNGTRSCNMFGYKDETIHYIKRHILPLTYYSKDLDKLEDRVIFEQLALGCSTLITDPSLLDIKSLFVLNTPSFLNDEHISGIEDKYLELEVEEFARENREYRKDRYKNTLLQIKLVKEWYERNIL